MGKLKLQNACAVFDYTIKSKDLTVEDVKKWCKEWGKEWAFQKEQGKKSDYIHYQLRISLRSKTRTPPYLKGAKPSVTSLENRDNNFYVLKEDTRIEGPWTSKDKEIFIPRQYRDITKLYAWQNWLLNKLNEREDRKIYFIYDKVGNNGKSTIAALCELKHNCIDVPPINDSKELMQIVSNICIDTDNRSPKAFFIDLPRAFDKKTLNGIFSAIEQIKKGKLYDTRYHYKAYWIDSPQIFVFSNEPPNFEYLSADRWICNSINSTYDDDNNIIDKIIVSVGGKPVITKQKRLIK